MLIAAIVLGAAAASHAQQAPPDEEARTIARIKAERAAADADYERKVKECAERFVVTSCVNDARAERHAVHARLDREQEALDTVRRAQRAAERRKAIEDKTVGDEAKAREAAALERSQVRQAAPAEPVQAAPHPASGAASRPAKPLPDAAQRAEQEARARHAYELKQLQAEAHRRQVEERNAEHARKTNPGAPLPVPAASVAASTASMPR